MRRRRRCPGRTTPAFVGQRARVLRCRHDRLGRAATVPGVRVGLRFAAASVEGEHWRTDCSYPCNSSRASARSARSLVARSGTVAGQVQEVFPPTARMPVPARREGQARLRPSSSSLASPASQAPLRDEPFRTSALATAAAASNGAARRARVPRRPGGGSPSADASARSTARWRHRRPWRAGRAWSRPGRHT
jgi:hypothetical protein